MLGREEFDDISNCIAEVSFIAMVLFDILGFLFPSASVNDVFGAGTSSFGTGILSFGILSFGAEILSFGAGILSFGTGTSSFGTGILSFGGRISSSIDDLGDGNVAGFRDSFGGNLVVAVVVVVVNDTFISLGKEVFCVKVDVVFVLVVTGNCGLLLFDGWPCCGFGCDVVSSLKSEVPLSVALLLGEEVTL